LFQYIVASILIGLEICFQKVGEEKYLQDSKHDKKFYQDNNPNLFAPA